MCFSTILNLKTLQASFGLDFEKYLAAPKPNLKNGVANKENMYVWVNNYTDLFMKKIFWKIKFALWALCWLVSHEFFKLTFLRLLIFLSLNVRWLFLIIFVRSFWKKPDPLTEEAFNICKFRNLCFVTLRDISVV